MSAASSIRLAEVIAALSLATDLGLGQQSGFALRSCILGVRLAEALGYSDEGIREVYYQSLLRYIGCNVDTLILAAVVGDEFALRHDFSLVDNGNTQEIVDLFVRYIRQVNAGAEPPELTSFIASGLATLPQITASFVGHCEVAQRLATRLGFNANVVYALGQLYERWDGKGMPRGLKGEAIAPAVLVVTLAQDAVLFHGLGGVEVAVKIARERNGGAYAPFIVERFCQYADQLFAGIDDEPSWETVMALESSRGDWLTDEQFDSACRAMADFVDIKSTSTLNHSHEVARTAAAAASHAGLPSADVQTIRRAGWLHDIGKTGITANILEKAGSLNDREWERVRLHPYYTERILARSTALSQIGRIATLHHELLDGSGYHRGFAAAAISPAARLLAAANRYCALLDNRPYRPAAEPEAAAELLKRDVHAGRLDGDAVHCVLASAGHRVTVPESVAGLSEREIEVLRLLARGSSTKEIAVALTISPKTADHHVQHIYTKIDVSTRAAAALFAIEHHLLSTN